MRMSSLHGLGDSLRGAAICHRVTFAQPASATLKARSRSVGSKGSRLSASRAVSPARRPRLRAATAMALEPYKPRKQVLGQRGGAPR